MRRKWILLILVINVIAAVKSAPAQDSSSDSSVTLPLKAVVKNVNPESGVTESTGSNLPVQMSEKDRTAGDQGSSDGETDKDHKESVSPESGGAVSNDKDAHISKIVEKTTVGQDIQKLPTGIPPVSHNAVEELSANGIQGDVSVAMAGSPAGEENHVDDTPTVEGSPGDGSIVRDGSAAVGGSQGDGTSAGDVSQGGASAAENGNQGDNSVAGGVSQGSAPTGGGGSQGGDSAAATGVGSQGGDSAAATGVGSQGGDSAVGALSQDDPVAGVRSQVDDSATGVESQVVTLAAADVSQDDGSAGKDGSQRDGSATADGSAVVDSQGGEAAAEDGTQVVENVNQGGGPGDGSQDESVIGAGSQGVNSATGNVNIDADSAGSDSKSPTPHAQENENSLGPESNPVVPEEPKDNTEKEPNVSVLPSGDNPIESPIEDLQMGSADAFDTYGMDARGSSPSAFNNAVQYDESYGPEEDEEEAYGGDIPNRVEPREKLPGINNGGKFTDDEDSHFFAYFLTIMVTAIIFYLVFHNKQRIIALIIEGRAPGNGRSRRTSSRAKYHKLDNNLEEAITATKGTNGC